jgi:tryptophan-rich sensory protein
MILNNKYIHILIPILLASIINITIYRNKWNMDSKTDYKKKYNLLPPGYVIAIVWFIILGLLGYLHYELFNNNNKKCSLGTLSIIFFILFCLAYPFLTNGLNVNKGLLLNLITLVLAFILAIIILYETKNIGYLVYLIPLLLWTFYVNFVFVIECSKILI